MYGLIIGIEPIEQILSGQKIWEIRGKRTAIRGTIALIKKGTKTVVGTAEIVAVHGPLSLTDQRKHADKHLPTPKEYKQGCYPQTYAWELTNVKRLRKPVPYQHPSGAVIWVILPDDLVSR
jgi:ASCH domain